MKLLLFRLVQLRNLSIVIDAFYSLTVLYKNTSSKSSNIITYIFKIINMYLFYIFISYVPSNIVYISFKNLKNSSISSRQVKLNFGDFWENSKWHVLLKRPSRRHLNYGSGCFRIKWADTNWWSRGTLSLQTYACWDPLPCFNLS